MRVLVLGGTRFIGAAAVRALVAMGHRVTVFHRGQTEAELPPEVEHIHGDQTALGDHRYALAAARPDVVLATLVMAESEALDVAMAVMATTARRLVVLSSQDVYAAWGRLLGTEPGAPDPTPLTENSPRREKLYPYRDRYPEMRRYDKIPVENVSLSSPRMPGTILRLPRVYGPGDGQHRFRDWVRQIDKDNGGEILIDERQAGWRWAAAYIDDVGHAIALAVSSEEAAGKVYNIAERDTPTEADRAAALARALGASVQIRPVPASELPDYEPSAFTLNTAQPIVVDSSRIREELGYSEVTEVEEALRRTAAWERG